MNEDRSGELNFLNAKAVETFTNATRKMVEEQNDRINQLENIVLTGNNRIDALQQQLAHLIARIAGSGPT